MSTCSTSRRSGLCYSVYYAFNEAYNEMRKTIDVPHAGVSHVCSRQSSCILMQLHSYNYLLSFYPPFQSIHSYLCPFDLVSDSALSRTTLNSSECFVYNVCLLSLLMFRSHSYIVQLKKPIYSITYLDLRWGFMF